jgi:hypothetical protein
MSTEITILAVTAITASLLYISKHLTSSDCWTREKCCSIKLRADSQSVITQPSVMEYRDTHSHTKFKAPVETVETVEPAIVSSTI